MSETNNQARENEDGATEQKNVAAELSKQELSEANDNISDVKRPASSDFGEFSDGDSNFRDIEEINSAISEVDPTQQIDSDKKITSDQISNPPDSATLPESAFDNQNGNSDRGDSLLSETGKVPQNRPDDSPTREPNAGQGVSFNIITITLGITIRKCPDTKCFFALFYISTVINRHFEGYILPLI